MTFFFFLILFLSFKYICSISTEICLPKTAKIVSSLKNELWT